MIKKNYKISNSITGAYVHHSFLHKSYPLREAYNCSYINKGR